MQGGKRRTVVCAAANDSDEELGELFESAAKKARVSTGAKEEAGAEQAGAETSDAPASGRAPPKKEKKEKEFAWMDSEEEDDDEKKEEKEDLGNDKVPLADDEETATIETLEACDSFGRMLLLAPSLQRWFRGGTMGPLDVVAACNAIMRTKFFDGDILEELWPVLKKMLSRNELDHVQTTDVLLCLKTLNTYDKGVFEAIARCFAAKTMHIEADMRHFWIEVFKEFGHKGEKAFLQLLEVPPQMPGHPAYKVVRCWHCTKDVGCVLGESACSYSHDPRAPMSLADGGKEDWWKTKSVIMTQNQKSMGFGVYGYGQLGQKEKDQKMRQ